MEKKKNVEKIQEFFDLLSTMPEDVHKTKEAFALSGELDDRLEEIHKLDHRAFREIFGGAYFLYHPEWSHKAVERIFEKYYGDEDQEPQLLYQWMPGNEEPEDANDFYFEWIRKRNVKPKLQFFKAVEGSYRLEQVSYRVKVTDRSRYLVLDISGSDKTEGCIRVKVSSWYDTAKLSLTWYLDFDDREAAMVQEFLRMYNESNEWNPYGIQYPFDMKLTPAKRMRMLIHPDHREIVTEDIFHLTVTCRISCHTDIDVLFSGRFLNISDEIYGWGIFVLNNIKEISEWRISMWQKLDHLFYEEAWSGRTVDVVRFGLEHSYLVYQMENLGRPFLEFLKENKG